MSLGNRHFFVCAAFVLAGAAATSGAEAILLADGEPIVAIAGSAEPVELDAAVGLALAANAQVLAEREGLAAFQAQVLQARATAFPRFDLQSGFSRGRDPSFALDSSFSDALPFGPEDIPAQTFWRSSLDGSWELRLTRIGYALRAAHAALRQQRQLVLDTEQRTTEAVVRAYHAIAREQEELRALQAELTARQEFLRISRRRFLLELDAPLDTLRAAVGVANLLPTIRLQERALRAAGEDLNILMGRDANAPLSVRAETEVEWLELDAPTVLASAGERPDLLRAAEETAFLRGRRNVVSADNHPYLSIEGSYGYVGRQADAMFESGHDAWQASVTLNWQLWDGFATKGRKRDAEAAVRRNEHLESELWQRARAEILGALDDLAAARANLRAATLSLSMADDAHRLTLRRYELGKSSYLEVLDAQSERFRAHGNLVEARYEVQSTTATLKRAVGRSPLSPLADVFPSQTREVP
jgi:outer membrane protein TolC